MFRTALLQGRHAARTAGTSAVRPAGASSATAHPPIESEQWVEADVNVAAGAVEFSEPLTVEELEASRDQIVAHLNQSWAASEDGDDASDPDEQMQTLAVHTNAVFQRTEPRSVLDAALSMANVPAVQHACMDAIRHDPTVYAAFSKLCAQHDMTVTLTGPTPLALPAAASGGPASHPAAGEEEAAGPPPLRVLLDAVSGALGAAGREVAAYVDRLQTRLRRLVLRLRGVDPDGPAPGGGGKGAAGPPAVEGRVLMDITITAASLLVVVALLMRHGPIIAAVVRN